MGLGRKNLAYSTSLAGMLLLFLLGYFVYMLPSLYVDYVMEQNLKSIRQQHNSYVQNGTYEGVSVKNPVACFSMEIPYGGNSVLITGKAFTAEIVMKDERLVQMLKKYCGRQGLLSQGSGEAAVQGKRKEKNFTDIQKELEVVGDIFTEMFRKETELPVEFRFLYQQDMEQEFHNGSMTIHSYADNMIILETSVDDSANRYMNYIAVEEGENSLIISILPVIAPEMNEIRPIVLQSIPMLAAVILLMVLVFSQIYSRGIVAPIVRLGQHAEQMKYTLACAAADTDNQPERYGRAERCSGAGKRGEAGKSSGAGKRGEAGKGSGAGKRGRAEKDEVAELSDILDDFYGQIRKSLERLEDKNRDLEKENERQEIFLRASSHQLKTPVTAALLLVDGMINEVGRYKDVKAYLPKVKEQLLSMRKMVEDILYLNRCAENMNFIRTEPDKLVRKSLQAYQVSIAEKRLEVDFAGRDELVICMDETVFMQVMDNILSNAVKYTPPGGKMKITIAELAGGGLSREEENWEIRLENYGVTIPETLLPHIFEPFVSGSHGADMAGTGSHGLGLYIASYYAGKLGLNLSVYNGEGEAHVITVLSTLPATAVQTYTSKQS